MANSKISALTSATTPLVGTETLPIVQGGATVKTTVAAITNGGGYAGSFTTLASTGNTTLGDASTDTVTVNGYMGIGGATPASNIGVQVTNNGTLTTIGQFGLQVDTYGSSAATTSIQAIFGRANTAAAAFTVTDLAGFRVGDAQKGTGSTITNQHGFRIFDQTQGTNNYGISSAVTSGTNKWNIYASGTAQNGFAGNVRIGSVTAPTVALDVTGAVKVSSTITPLDNVVIGTSGKGIDFSVVTHAGSTSKLLADYEEGTWTPTDASGAGLAIAITASTTPRYVKIGRLVVCSADVTYPVTASAAIARLGLAFSPSATNPSGCGVVTFKSDGIITFGSTSATGSVFLNPINTFLTNANFSNVRFSMVWTFQV